MRASEQIGFLWKSDLDLASKLRYIRARIPGQPRSGKTIHLQFNSGVSARLRAGAADIYIFEEMFVQRSYYRLAERLPRKAARILDLGANVGLSAIVLQQIYPGAEIICVEPEAGNFALLQENVHQFGGRIRAVRGFVGGGPGSGYLRGIGEAESAYRLSREVGGGAAVRIWTVEQLLEWAGWETFDLLKCDIEGTEAELFRDAPAWLDRCPAMMVELHGGYGVAEFRQDLGKRWEIWGDVQCAARKRE